MSPAAYVGRAGQLENPMTSANSPLAGTVALVTGASSGNGRRQPPLLPSKPRLATSQPWRRLTAEDIANAILSAVRQPPRANVNEILIRPTEQER
jgi:NADP-dependent 3-hydroxy acid dehydrogenase YdfG